jgi:hypothetical protein
MKTLPQFLAAAVVAAMALSACVKDGITQLDPNEVRFTAGIAGVATPSTRAADATWTAGDEIGIFMVGHGNTTIVNDTSNRLYTADEDGGDDTEFSPVPETSGIQFPASGAVDFISYYPYTGSATLVTPIDVTIQTPQTTDNQPDFDLLWTKATGTGGAGYTKGSGNVALTFEHQLTKLAMTTIAGDGVTGDLAAMTVTITGTNTTNTFNLADGVLGTGTVPSPIEARVVGERIYDAIIMPGEYEDGTVKVTFDLGGEIFTWNVGEISFEPKKQYNYSVTLSRTGVTVTGTITDWEDVDGGGVIAN